MEATARTSSSAARCSARQGVGQRLRPHAGAPGWARSPWLGQQIPCLLPSGAVALAAQASLRPSRCCCAACPAPRCDTPPTPWPLSAQAALEAPWVVPCGGAPYGDENLLFVPNDWHTALVPLYLQASGQGFNPLLMPFLVWPVLSTSRRVLVPTIVCLPRGEGGHFASLLVPVPLYTSGMFTCILVLPVVCASFLLPRR